MIFFFLVECETNPRAFNCDYIFDWMVIFSVLCLNLL